MKSCQLGELPSGQSKASLNIEIHNGKTISIRIFKVLRNFSYDTNEILQNTIMFIIEAWGIQNPYVLEKFWNIFVCRCLPHAFWKWRSEYPEKAGNLMG